MKRIILFLVTNLAILVVLGLVFRIVGLEYAFSDSGVDLTGLFIFAALFGMGGSLFSLFSSKWMAKRAVGAQVIEQPMNAGEQWLLQMVAYQAQQAGIDMPEVAIYESPEPNAFATGANRNKALVAVSSGLLQAMDENEIEAVLGHEISHVANGDMVTLTLIQGVLNTFVIFLARIVGMIVDRGLSSNNNDSYAGPGMGYFITSMIAEILLGFLASIIVMAFSRHREFRADAGGAELAGRNKMMAALRRLQQLSEPSQLPGEMAAFGISPGQSKLSRLFMSHPPLEERIAMLEGRR